MRPFSFILGGMYESTEHQGSSPHLPEHTDGRSEFLCVSLGWGGARAMCHSTVMAGVSGTERPLEKACDDITGP